ncbi:hypothetical protein SS50377_23634 [Spironucleus salmonicida]|uniref:Uncharacterized protein n=1 Tax=Spironucleus salmonicida TaxID=348837 RepID=V6LY21_9EUKA|nr:hypothetical protein SS50377_23634 [Spironucleus salmonicida]|eukprot:EST48616.1 Hypothetical protein SS50377_11228 [Spironucleus salmonicida]
MNFIQTRLVKPLSPTQKYLKSITSDNNDLISQQISQDSTFLNNLIARLADSFNFLQKRQNLLIKKVRNQTLEIQKNQTRINELLDYCKVLEREMHAKALVCVKRVNSAIWHLESLHAFIDEVKLKRAILRFKKVLESRAKDGDK